MILIRSVRQLNTKIKLIHLHQCRGAGWKTIRSILANDPLLSTLYTKTTKEWADLLMLPCDKLDSFLRDLHSLNLQKLLDQYDSNDIQILSFFDEDYPYLLKQIYDPPWILYMKGNRGLLKDLNGIGVVGARKPSVSGLQALKSLVPPLVQAEFLIISGVAAGIDAAAHHLTLKEKGKTMGVLGGGHFHIYPKGNIPLAREIMKKGLLLSETPPQRRAEPWMFPMRNRIISGLSRGVLVVEARQKSGTLITAQFALDQGREVFAVPGSPSHDLSTGTNRLIQEGAKLVLTAKDIIDELPMLSPGKNESTH